MNTYTPRNSQNTKLQICTILNNSRLWNGQKHLPQNILHETEYKRSSTDIINNDDTFQRALKIHKSHILAMGRSKFKPYGLA
jgi:hypothetical protein